MLRLGRSFFLVLVCVLLLSSSGGCQPGTQFRSGSQSFSLPSSVKTIAVGTGDPYPEPISFVSVRTEKRSDLKVEWEIASWGIHAISDLESSSIITREEGGGVYRVLFWASKPGERRVNLNLTMPDGMSLDLTGGSFAVQGNFRQVKVKSEAGNGNKVDLSSKAEIFQANLLFSNLQMHGDAERMDILIRSEAPHQFSLNLDTPLQGSSYHLDIFGPVELTIPSGSTGRVGAQSRSGSVKCSIPFQGEYGETYLNGFLNGQDEKRSIVIKAVGDISISATP